MKPRYPGEWKSWADEMFGNLVMAIFLANGPAVIVLFWAFVDAEGPMKFLALVGIVLSLSYTYFVWSAYQNSKDKVAMWFNGKDKEVAHAIGEALTTHGVRSTRVSQHGILPRSPHRCIEVFKVYHGKIGIRIRRQTKNGTLVELGPIRKEYDPPLRTIKRALNDVYDSFIYEVD